MMNVIFFSDGGATAFDSRANVIVNAATKAQAKAFIENASSRGTSEPFAAVRNAARLSADLVYFLADGEMEIPGTPNLVIDEFARANFHPMTRVNTILFENKEPGSERVLKEIAAKYNGTYRYIPPND